MPINYEEIENDICLVLCPVDEEGVKLNTVYTAQPLPDNESENQRNFSKANVCVICTNSDFDNPDNLNVVTQKETINIEVQIRTNSRRVEKGIFSIMKDIKSKLLGYKLGKGYTQLQLVKNGYLDTTTQNDWNYAVVFSTTTRVAENLPEPTYPKFVQIDLVDK